MTKYLMLFALLAVVAATPAMAGDEEGTSSSMPTIGMDNVSTSGE